MTKFLSGRQKNLKIGITSYSENIQVLEVIGRVGIGSTVFNADYDLDVRGTSRFSGISTFTNGPVLIGGSIGIGTTNPTSKLWVDGDGYFTGILTANRIFSGQYGEFTGGVIVGTNIVGTTLSISGISTFTNGPVLIGGGTSTGTAGQILQVSGINSSVYIGGNLGIGVTNSTSALQVNGRIYSGNNISTSNISNIVVKNIGVGYSAERSFNLVDTSAAIKIVRTHDSFGAILDLHQWNAGITTMLSYWDIVSESGTFSIRDRIGNYTKTNPEISRLFINSYGNVLLGASSNNGLDNIVQSVGYGTANILQVNGNSYLGGFVGIGTTNPQVKLDISGDIRVSSGSTFVFGTGLGIGATAPGYTYALSNPFTSVQIGETAGRTGNALVDIRASNYPDGTNVLNVQTTSETYTGTIGTYKPYTPAGTVIEIGNTRASQRVGIGSTLFGRSAALISIYAYNNDNVTNAFFGAVAGDVSNGPSNFVFGRRTGVFSWEETVRIDTSGNLGIGTTNPTSKLHVVGDTYISGILTATDINSASDIRLKTNIKPFENTLEKIVQINGVSFNWIDSNAKSGGIIAQDVEKVFPELVNDGDHKTVNYNGLIGVLIESIKELKQEVEDLKSRLPGI